MVSAETERARTPNQRRLVSRRAKITLKYGQCVGLGAVLKGKLAAASKKAGDDLFFVFTSSLAGVFVKLKPSLKISRSATVVGVGDTSHDIISLVIICMIS